MTRCVKSQFSNFHLYKRKQHAAQPAPHVPQGCGRRSPSTTLTPETMIWLPGMSISVAISTELLAMPGARTILPSEWRGTTTISTISTRRSIDTSSSTGSRAGKYTMKRGHGTSHAKASSMRICATPPIGLALSPHLNEKLLGESPQHAQERTCFRSPRRSDERRELTAARMIDAMNRQVMRILSVSYQCVATFTPFSIA